MREALFQREGGCAVGRVDLDVEAGEGLMHDLASFRSLRASQRARGAESESLRIPDP
jgi:hypothetical protein